MGGEGEGQYLNQKHSLCIQKKKKIKKSKKKKKIFFLTEPGFEPTTSGLKSTRLNTIIPFVLTPWPAKPATLG